MADYSNFISLAQRLIAKKGAPMTYVSVRDHGEIDPHTGKRPVDVEAFEVIGVCTKPTKDELQAGYTTNYMFLRHYTGSAWSAWTKIGGSASRAADLQTLSADDVSTVEEAKNALDTLDDKYLTPRTLAGLTVGDEGAQEKYAEHERLAEPLRIKLAELEKLEAEQSQNDNGGEPMDEHEIQDNKEAENDAGTTENENVAADINQDDIGK